MPKLIKTPITQNTHNFDLSLLVKKYISNQTDEQQPPFNYSQFRRPYIRNHNQYYYQTAMKASLSDWRSLIDRSQTANKSNKDNNGNKNTEVNGNETPSKTNKNKTQAPRSKTQANVRSDRKIDLQQSYISRNTYSNIKYNKNRTKIINQNEQSNSGIRNNNRMTAITTRQFDNRSYVKFNVNNTQVQMQTHAQKTSTSFRESHLDSALVQNYYQAEYIKERAIQTAKIRRHYQKPHQNRPVSINCENTTNMKIHINDKSDNDFNSYSNKKLNPQQTNTPITPSKPHKQYKQMAQQHQNQNQQQQNKCYHQFQQYQQEHQQVKKFQLNNTLLKQKQNILSKNINNRGNINTNINMYINKNRNINRNINKRQMYKSGKIISSPNCDKDGYWMPEKYQKVTLKKQFIRRVNDIIIEGLTVSPQKQYNKINYKIEGGLRFYQTKK